MRNIFFILLCLVIFNFSSQGQNSKYSSLTSLKWLTGNWKGLYNDAPFYESWVWVHDSLMVNLSIEIKGADTTVKEHGFIRLKNGNITHGNKDAVWQLAKLSDTEMIFINDTLKFANRITWSHSANDHWLTEIHNPKGIIHYDLERVPWLNNAVNRFIHKK